MKIRSVLPAMMLVVACSGEPSGPPPEILLARTSDTLVARVVAITSAVPQSGGSWVLLAPEEGAVLVANFAAKAVTPHPAASPAPTQGPAVLIGVGDTVVVGDWSTQRFSIWMPSGEQVAAVPVPGALAGAFPRARDAAGQWYFEIGPPPGRDGSGLRDSSALVRSDATLGRFDTIARLAPPDLVQVTTAEGSRLSRTALSGRDRWGVERDGTVWIARVDQNYIEWFRVGGEDKGKTDRLPDPILPVEEMDRQMYINRFPEEYRENARQVRFTPLKPPFEAVLPLRPGMWMVEKNGLALDSTRAFQVVDADGVIRRVIAPSRGNALGFDGTHLLMAEQFPGGVRLLRYLVPPNAVAPRETDG